MRHSLLPVDAILTVLGVLLIATGCAQQPASPDSAGEEVAEAPESDPEPEPFLEYREDATVAYDNRIDRDEAMRAIDLWNQALRTDDAEQYSDSQRAEVYENIARAHFFVARFHDADGPVVDPDDELGDNLESGLDSARNALQIHAPQWIAAIDAGAPFEADLPDPPPEATEALLWYAKLLDLRASTGNLSTTVSTRPLIDAIMDIVTENNPELYHGAAHRYFGVRHIDRHLHIDPDAAERSFERSREVDPDFALTKLLRAYHLRGPGDDRSAFESELQAIVEQSDDDLEERIAENEIVRQWARDLLERGVE